jgi:multidrug efflux pump subunit AcrA (membrane-fusion protein)
MSQDRKSFALYGAALGLLVLVIALVLKPSPPVAQGKIPAALVEIIMLEKVPLAPEISGFGRVEPKHVWDAISEVTGKVTYRHPQLESGRMLPKGTHVLAIDPLEYELKLAQAQAALHSTQAQLTRLAQQERNLNASLGIEQKKLVLAEQEYQRKLILKKRQLVSNSELESQNQALLVQSKLVEDLKSSLKLLPDDRNVTRAQLNVDEAKVKDAERKLSQTQVFLPFDARIAQVNIEAEQVVTLGMTMLEAHQLGTAVIKAQVSLHDMRTLVNSLSNLPTEQSIPAVELLELNANINLQVGKAEFNWPARLTRIAEMVDPNQASLGIYLEVEQDYSQLNILKSPPLTKGMFVTATILGQASPQFVVPQRALHGESLYFMTADNKLAIKKVNILFRSQGKVAISLDTGTASDNVTDNTTDNINVGDRLVVNDLIPAVAGMNLRVASSELTQTKPQLEHYLAAKKADASGKGALEL